MNNQDPRAALREQLKDTIRVSLGNHSNEFLNPWLVKGNLSHEELAETLNNIVNSERFATKLMQLFDTYANQREVAAQNKLLTEAASKVEYTWGEVDNWIFAYGDELRKVYIERKLSAPQGTDQSNSKESEL